MKNIENIKEKMFNASDRAKGMAATAENENRALTQDEKREIEDLYNEVRSLQNKIDTETNSQAEAAKQATAAPGQASYSGEKRTVKDNRSYRSLFYKDDNIQLERGGFGNIGEYMQVINSGRFDPRLQELRQNQAGVGALGGFSVPEEFGAWLMDTSIEDEIVRGRATIHEMQSSVKHIPAFESLDKSGNVLYGGLQGRWVAELEQNIPQEARMRSMTLNVNKLAIFADVSSELLQDSNDFENNLGRAMVKALGYHMDLAFLTGAGAGSPLGVLNDPALLSVARTGFPSTAPGDNYIDLVQMYNRLHKSGPGQPVWIVNHEVIPELVTMTDVNGNLIYQTSARDSVPASIFGYPVLTTEKLPIMAMPGSIVLANLSHYQIGLRKEIYMDASNAPGFMQDYQSFRSIIRADGQGAWNEPMTQPDGSQVSWCVSLQ